MPKVGAIIVIQGVFQLFIIVIIYYGSSIKSGASQETEDKKQKQRWTLVHVKLIKNNLPFLSVDVSQNV